MMVGVSGAIDVNAAESSKIRDGIAVYWSTTSL
jgi:hypothetical protein